jgi:hypothetical protein
MRIIDGVIVFDAVACYAVACTSPASYLAALLSIAFDIAIIIRVLGAIK